MSPHSSPRGRSKTGPGRRRKSSLGVSPFSGHRSARFGFALFDPVFCFFPPLRSLVLAYSLCSRWVSSWVCFCSCCVSKGLNEDTISRLTSVLLPRGFVSYFIYHKQKKHQKPSATLVNSRPPVGEKKQLRIVREIGYTSWNDEFEPLPTPSQPRLAYIVQQQNVACGKGMGKR